MFGLLIELFLLPAGVLIHQLGMGSSQDAESVVRGRTQAGPFCSVDELRTVLALSPRVVDDIRDRAVFL